MSGWVEQHLPTRVRLLGQRGAKRDGSLSSRGEIVGGQIKMHDRRPRLVRGDVTVDLLGNQHSSGHLDRDAGLLRPQLAAPEQAQVEVGRRCGSGQSSEMPTSLAARNAVTAAPYARVVPPPLLNVRICRDPLAPKCR